MNVSVCIATYNRDVLLNNTLRSIQEHSPPWEFEVVVVDDGSNDDTASVCADYPFVRYFYLHRPYYCGPARALNVAIKAAASDIVILQNSKCAHQSNAIEEFYKMVTESPGLWIHATVTAEETGRYWQRPSSCPGLYWFCALQKEHLVSVNGLDEDFTYLSGEDNDLRDRLRNLGLNIKCVPHVRGMIQFQDKVVFDVDAVRFQEMQELYQVKKRQRRIKANVGREWGLQDDANSDLV